MRVLIGFLLVSITTAFIYKADEDGVYSIYFDYNYPPSKQEISAIDPAYYHTYTLKSDKDIDLRVSAGDEITVSEKGIVLNKNKFLSISRAEIRENSAYEIRNDYLHGLIPNDSLPVSLDGERYYFLYPQETVLYAPNRAGLKLYNGLNAGEYILFYKDAANYYSVTYFDFNSNNLQLKSLDYEEKKFNWRDIDHSKTTVDDIPTYVLKPSTEEWKEVLKYFTTYDKYKLKGEE